MAVATKEPQSAQWARFFSSSIGKKILTGITGISLVLFVIAHLLGNLALFVDDGGEAFNAYGHFLHSLGPLFYAIEIGLLGVIVVHAVIGILIYLRKRKARPVGYSKYKSVGGASRQSLSSRSMIVTGLILLIFLVIHVINFRFGTYYETTLADGHVARDLHRLVVEKFQHPIYVIGYVLVMVLLLFHLRHGIWSALQSLGALRPKISSMVYAAALVLAVALGLGFLALPVWVYFMY